MYILQACGARQQGDEELRSQPVPEQALPRRGRDQPFRGTRRWDILGLLWDILGHLWDIWDFYIQLFSGPRRWGILVLLHPTLFRAKEVGHFGTFMGHFGTFTSSPFQGQGSEHFGHFTSLHPTLLRDNRTRWWDI